MSSRTIQHRIAIDDRKNEGDSNYFAFGNGWTTSPSSSGYDLLWSTSTELTGSTPENSLEGIQTTVHFTGVYTLSTYHHKKLTSCPRFEHSTTGPSYMPSRRVWPDALLRCPRRGRGDHETGLQLGQSAIQLHRLARRRPYARPSLRQPMCEPRRWKSV